MSCLKLHCTHRLSCLSLGDISPYVLHLNVPKMKYSESDSDTGNNNGYQLIMKGATLLSSVDHYYDDCESWKRVGRTESLKTVPDRLRH